VVDRAQSQTKGIALAPSITHRPPGSLNRTRMIEPLRRPAEVVTFPGSRPSLFEPGNNCWRVEQASRAAFLIDGDAYFDAFRRTAAQARRRLMILGWDFDSRIRLLIDRPSDGLPERLGEFLHELLIRRKDLHIYVLTWDFHMIYWKEREWWLPSKLVAHRRLHFVKDGTHPLGASHHQKIVVIDDAVAFVGGLDFAPCRWDTSRHALHPERRLADDRPCRPFHDVQMMVDGAAASALGDLARLRWQQATGQSLTREPLMASHDPWPEPIRPDLHRVKVAIARTAPTFDGRPAIAEVETLLLDVLKSARRYVYIETQYLTSRTIADCLTERLMDPRGPEIVLVLHPNSDGWLEQHTMDVLRGRVLERLRAADRHRRLRLYYPSVPDLDGQCISMHSKVCIVDDALVRIGSANLSNRSMGFDTECDLAVEAGGDQAVRSNIAAFLHRLLAEHLHASVDEVAAQLERTGSLIGAIERLRRDGRSLEPFDGSVSADVNEVIPDEHFIDPSRPYDVQWIPPERRRPATMQIAIGTVGLLALVILAGLWQWTPLREQVDILGMASYLEDFGRGPTAPIVTIGGFLIGGLLVVPVMIPIAVTVLAFGPWWGFWYALIGMTLSAMLTFGVGRLLGRRLMDRLSGSRVYRVSLALASRGILAVATLRILPVAPFSIVNAIAGASHIRTRDFLIGTVLGELPGLMGISLFISQITETIRHPGAGSIALLAAIAGILLLSAVGLGRWLARKGDRKERPA